MIGDITETILLLGLLKMLILVLKSHQFIFKPTAQVLTGRSGPLPARRVKKANLGLIFAACGGFCFSTWPCLGSLVEGQTQWTTWDSGPKLNASAFFFVYALGAVIAVLLLLPPLCRWPLHTGVNLNFWRPKGESCQGMGHRWFWWWSTHKGKVFPDLFHWCFFHYLQIT